MLTQDNASLKRGSRIFFSAQKFHQFDYSINEFCGLQLMVRVEVLGSVNPNPNPNRI